VQILEVLFFVFGRVTEYNLYRFSFVLFEQYVVALDQMFSDVRHLLVEVVRLPHLLVTPEHRTSVKPVRDLCCESIVEMLWYHPLTFPMLNAAVLS
jgi:hypothetical protein